MLLVVSSPTSTAFFCLRKPARRLRSRYSCSDFTQNQMVLFQHHPLVKLCILRRDAKVALSATSRQTNSCQSKTMQTGCFETYLLCSVVLSAYCHAHAYRAATTNSSVRQCPDDCSSACRAQDSHARKAGHVLRHQLSESWYNTLHNRHRNVPPVQA